MNKRIYQHYLNQALNDVLQRQKIKVKNDLELDIGLEFDYFELLTKFEEHIKLIKKINKRVK